MDKTTERRDAVSDVYLRAGAAWFAKKILGLESCALDLPGGLCPRSECRSVGAYAPFGSGSSNWMM